VDGLVVVLFMRFVGMMLVGVSLSLCRSLDVVLIIVLSSSWVCEFVRDWFLWLVCCSVFSVFCV